VIWLQFLLSSTVIVLAAQRLAQYGDVIAVRTRVGGMFVGTLLLALATSLPELLTMIAALGEELPSMAAGNIFGSCMFNMFLLAVLDTTHRHVRLLRSVFFSHAIGGTLAILMAAATVFFVMADLPWALGWLGIDSLILMAIYLGGVMLLRSAGPGDTMTPQEGAPVVGLPPLWQGIVGFVLASGVLVAVTPFLVSSAAEIAEITGVSAGFVGAFALAIVTSLPEAVTTISAIRIGAYDMAVGNLFGSNVFNIFALAFTDLFYTQGRFLGAIDDQMLLAAMLGLVLTALGLLGNVSRIERRLSFVEIDAALITVVYVLGLGLLFARGVPVG
jgi:cation:H+ antiporter